jgi:hypothetical protein
MTDIYIKNKGYVKTFISENDKHKTNEMDWDADYDGDEAKVSLRVNDDGKKQKYKLRLDNEDLADMLNIPSVNMPLEKRLLRDFKYKRRQQKQIQRGRLPFIELDMDDSLHNEMFIPPLSPPPPHPQIEWITLEERPPQIFIRQHKVSKRQRRNKKNITHNRRTKTRSTTRSKTSKKSTTTS